MLRKISMLLALTGVAAGFAACSDDEADSVSASYENIVLDQGQESARFVMRANTAWTAECLTVVDGRVSDAAPWFRLTPSEGAGTTPVVLDVLSGNHGVEARSGKIRVRYGNAEYFIDVHQRGLTDIGTRVTPELIGMGAKASTAGFSVAVENRDAVVTVSKKPGAEWLTLSELFDAGYGYSKKIEYGLATEDNDNADSRTAEIEVRIVFGYNTYEYTVTVVQDGLGAPAVMTAATAYMNCSQTEHRQSVWIAGGDPTNVNFVVDRTSMQSGVNDTEGWITDAKVVGGELVVTAAANTYDEAREGAVTIRATRPGAAESMVSVLTVRIVQAGHKAAGIVLASSEAAHDYKAALHSVFYTLLNGTNVTEAVANADWITDIAYTNGVLTYKVGEYTAPTADFREGTIRLLASNGHSNPAVASVKVRQYAPTLPALNLPEYIGVGYSAQNYGLPVNLQGGELAVLAAPAWAPATVTADGIAIAFAQNTAAAATDYLREGIVTLSYTKSGLTAYYYLHVRQYARDMAYLQKDGNYTVNGVVEGASQVLWWWHAHCNGSSYNDSYGEYSPFQARRLVYLKNVPYYQTIHLYNGNASDFSLAMDYTLMAVSAAPNAWQYPQVDRTETRTATVRVQIDCAPYVQTLTFTVQSQQTSNHNPIL